MSKKACLCCAFEWPSEVPHCINCGEASFAEARGPARQPKAADPEPEVAPDSEPPAIVSKGRRRHV